MSPIIPQKQCYKCKQFFDATLEFFYASTTNADRLNGCCKLCAKARSKAQHQVIRDKRMLGRVQVPDGCKQCSQCKTIYPATPEHFSIAKRCTYGVTGTCRGCEKSKREQNVPKPVHEGELKQCTECKRYLPPISQYFYANRYYGSGLMAHCKDCHNVKMRQHRQTHKEKYLAHEEEYRKTGVRQAYARTHKQEARRNALKYFHIHHEKCLQRRKRYVETHREEERQRSRTYHKTHKPSTEKMTVYARNRSSHKKNAPGRHTPAQIKGQLKRQRYRCYYCLEKFKKRNGRYVFDADHTFPVSRANGIDPINDISYIVLACPTCNRSKGNKYPWEWIEGGRLL